MTDTRHTSDNPQSILQAILDGTPTALVLLKEIGTIVFTNVAARNLFFLGNEAKGQNFLKLLGNVTEPLRNALLSDDDQIFTLEQNGESETYHLSKSQIAFEGQPHTLISARHMTREMAHEEIRSLKNTLRIIGHELANSMAPALSLLRSVRQMIARPEPHDRIETALDTVSARLEHLQSFLGGLAQLGQMPKPKPREVAWGGFIVRLRSLWPAVAITAQEGLEPGWFDPAHIEQLLINLVKNAYEAGGPEDAIAIGIEATQEHGVRITVQDNGVGMTDEVMKKAFAPAFTTKQHGSGIGLTLCREIADAHQGRLRISRREHGGTTVSLWLPSRSSEAGMNRALLTLTGTL